MNHHEYMVQMSPTETWIFFGSLAFLFIASFMFAGRVRAKQ